MTSFLTKNMLSQWLAWHFLEVPRSILKIFKGFLLFNFNYFSVPFLLKTFFTPWRRYKESYGRGFDIKRYLETFIFNLTSRILGAIVRTVIILIGLIFEVFIFIAGMAAFPIWIFLPILLIISFYLSLRSLTIGYNSGAIALIFNLVIAFFVINGFLNQKIKKAKQKYDLDYEAGRVLSKAENFAKRRKFEIVSEKILLYFLLKSKIKEVIFILSRGYFDFKGIQKTLRKEIKENKYQSDLSAKQIISEAGKIARDKGKERINAGDILISFAQNSPCFQKILIANDLKKGDIKNLVSWFERSERQISEAKKFWEYRNLLKRGFLGRDWDSGFTITMDSYSC